MNAPRRGLILTGTRGSGKTCLAWLLCREALGFCQPVGLTTRSPRPDDAGKYSYLTAHDFAAKERAGDFLVSSSYGESRYAVSHEAVDEIFGRAGHPLLTLTPEAAIRLSAELGWLAIFLDAPDEALNRRLLVRDGALRAQDYRQRSADRSVASSLAQVVNADGELAATGEILERLFLSNDG
jgi:guanylate kinase